MNEFQLQIERLVDGELPFEEEGTLLQSFEHQPSGWKQLAMAFLEERTFHASLGSGAAACSNAGSVPASAAEMNLKSATSMTRSWRVNVVRICAACAVLLTAFLSGRYSATAGLDAKPDQIMADSNPVGDSAKPDQSEHEIPQEELPPPIEFVSLNVGAEGEDARSVDVPLLPLDQIAGTVEADFIAQPPSLIPAEIREMLTRRGQAVRESIDYYQFRLSDGRVGVIPVSNIEIQASTWPPIQ